MFAFLRRWRAPRPTAGGPARRTRPVYRLEVEWLEARILLSASALDPTFGLSGHVATANILRVADPKAVVQPDDKIVVATGLWSAPGLAADSFTLARYTANGSLDATFGAGGTIQASFGISDETVGGIALQADGKILVVGSANGEVALARFNADGSVDTGFGTGGTVITFVGTGSSAGTSVAVAPDGRIVVAAAANDVWSPNTDFALVRYTADGSLDTTFGSNGTVRTSFSPGTGAETDTVTALALLPDGTIVAAGTAIHQVASFALTDRAAFAVALYNPDGSPDTAFGTSGQVTTEVRVINGTADLGVAGADVTADGRLVVGGNADGQFTLISYQLDGSLSAGFGRAGLAASAYSAAQGAVADSSAMVLQTDGKIVLAGDFAGPNSPWHMLVTRYTAQGSLDTSFGAAGQVLPSFDTRFDTATWMAFQSDGQLLLGGSASAVGGNTSDVALVRLTGTDTPITALTGGFPVVSSVVSGGITGQTSVQGVAAPGLSTLLAEQTQQEVQNPAVSEQDQSPFVADQPHGSPAPSGSTTAGGGASSSSSPSTVPQRPSRSSPSDGSETAGTGGTGSKTTLDSTESLDAADAAALRFAPAQGMENGTALESLSGRWLAGSGLPAPNLGPGDALLPNSLLRSRLVEGAPLIWVQGANGWMLEPDTTEWLVSNGLSANPSQGPQLPTWIVARLLRESGPDNSAAVAQWVGGYPVARDEWYSAAVAAGSWEEAENRPNAPAAPGEAVAADMVLTSDIWPVEDLLISLPAMVGLVFILREVPFFFQAAPVPQLAAGSTQTVARGLSTRPNSLKGPLHRG